MTLDLDELASKCHVSIGQVSISSVHIMGGTGALIVEIDCNTKRCEVFGYGSTEDSASLILVAGEHTLKALDSDAPTVVTLSLPLGTWIAFAESCRYTVRWALYRHDAARRVWESP